MSTMEEEVARGQAREVSRDDELYEKENILNKLRHNRGPWSPEEDAHLLSLVGTQGAHSWVQISAELGTRSPKQCRERYHQNLKPSLNHDPITPEEGAKIEYLVNSMGKRWAEIARQLKNRSDNAVKNWWNGGQNKKKRAEQRTPGAEIRHRQHQSRMSPHSHYMRDRDSFAYGASMSMHPSFARACERPSSSFSHYSTTRPFHPPPQLTDLSTKASAPAPSIVSPATSNYSRGSVETVPSLIQDSDSPFTPSVDRHPSYPSPPSEPEPQVRRGSWPYEVLPIPCETVQPRLPALLPPASLPSITELDRTIRFHVDGQQSQSQAQARAHSQGQILPVGLPALAFRPRDEKRRRESDPNAVEKRARMSLRNVMN